MAEDSTPDLRVKDAEKHHGSVAWDRVLQRAKGRETHFAGGVEKGRGMCRGRASRSHRGQDAKESLQNKSQGGEGISQENLQKSSQTMVSCCTFFYTVAS